MSTFDPKNTSRSEFYAKLIGTIAPRPIAFVSSINADGKVNLSPFSFFNLFSSKPPVLIFGPGRRGRDNTTKDTYNNAAEVSEVVVNIVTYGMVEQMSLTSCEYDSDVNEFIKGGFTEVASESVRPPRVKESPASFECKVLEIKDLGTEGGAGALVICEILKAHINDSIIKDDGQIDPHKLDVVSRMGSNWYCRAHGEALFQVKKPTGKGVGVDALPPHAITSHVLTGNDLGKLGGLEAVPDENEVQQFRQHEEVKKALAASDTHQQIHALAQQFLKKDEIENAWLALLQL